MVERVPPDEGLHLKPRDQMAQEGNRRPDPDPYLKSLFRDIPDSPGLAVPGRVAILIP